MTELIKRRSTCRLCDSSELELVLALTPTPPVDAYVEPSKLDEPQPAYPLELFACSDCGHAQLLDVVSPELLFGDYIYETSSSPGLVAHFRRYAEEVLELSGLDERAFAVDIGSNDGTLLRFLKERGLRVLGVDPAEAIARRATSAGIETIPSFMACTLAEHIREAHGQAELVTANNVFAHTDDMGEMADSVRELLSPRGLFVFEVSYLLDMIEGMLFDLIYHEHLCYHSVRPLRSFLRQHGLELIDVHHVPTKGGSLRCSAQLANGSRPVAPTVESFIDREQAAALYDMRTYDSWAGRIEALRNTVSELVTGIRSQGKTGAGYGASATTTVLIHHFNLAETLEFLVDDIPMRQGRFSPGHHIPVGPAEWIYDHSVDYVIILAWRFADMIVAKHREYLASGGRVVVPLPEPNVI